MNDMKNDFYFEFIFIELKRNKKKRKRETQMFLYLFMYHCSDHRLRSNTLEIIYPLYT